MIEHPFIQHNSQTPASIFALNLGRGVFLGCLLAIPWMIGGLPYWATLITTGLLFCLALLLGIASLFSRSEGSISKISILLGVLLAYASAQLLPLSNDPIDRLEHAINSDTITSVKMTDQLEREQAGQKYFPISCAPYKTRRTLAVYATGFAVFLFSGVLWNTPGRIRLLLLALTANGVVLSLFGMIQRFRWQGSIYGLYQLEHGGQPFASFVNRNNAASYLLVCLAAGLGLLMSYISSRNEHGYHGNSNRSRDHRILIGACLILISAGVVASLSRSGILSACIAAVVVLALILRNGRSILAALGFLGCLSALAIWFGWGSDLLNRFESLREINFDDIGRIQHWKNTLPALQDFGILGSGLGTYSMVNRPYQPHEYQGWYVNADNQYLEWTLELGIVGFSLVLLLVACLFVMTGKLLKSSRRQSGFRYSLGIAALFLLVSQLVHAVFDFGITIPATLLSVAAILGAISSHLAGDPGNGLRSDDEKGKSQLQLKWTPALALGCFVVITCALAVTGSAYKDEKIARQVSQSIQDVPKTTAEQLYDLQRNLTLRAESAPESPLVFESLAQVNQALMRLEFLKTQDASTPVEIGRYWNSSVPTRLIMTVLGQDTLTQALHRLWTKEDVDLASQEYENSLRQGIQLNPLNGRLWSELAVLNWIRMQDQKETGKLLDYAVTLRPSALNIQIIHAIQLAQSGEQAVATGRLQSLMTRFPQDASRIWEAATRCYSIPIIVHDVLPEDVEIWETIWEALSVRPEKQEDLLQFAASISNRLKKNSTESNSPSAFYLQGLADDLLGNPATALRQMDKAIKQRPLNTQWRSEYARILIKAGQIDAARKQLETAHQLQPNDRKIEASYRKVLALRSDTKKK
ncbi:MAG: O-antigen ligase family protein [Planctomycetaceae bacterium]|nr:O-antigen ligase family protein [Planctomycetaceae bacterium]